MRKFLLIFISVLILLPLSSCGYNESADTHSEVVINLPSDNMLNGYRTKAPKRKPQPAKCPIKYPSTKRSRVREEPRYRQVAMSETKRLMFSISQAVHL